MSRLSLVPAEGEPALEMPTSTGKRRADAPRRCPEVLSGRAAALAHGIRRSRRSGDAPAVRAVHRQTNGTETYTAGRYLDLDRTATNLYDLDFNRAYHPYCYYNPQYDCPYPPRENRLAVPIRAGERMRDERKSI